MSALKGVDPIVSTVMLVALVFLLGSIITVWTVDITRNVTNTTQDVTMSRVECQYAAYDFVYDFATKGVNYSFTGADDYIQVLLQNTGTVNVYNFSIQAAVSSSGILEIHDLEVNSTTQKTQASPLKPGQRALLTAVVSEDITGTLNSLRVNNLACMDKYVEQDF